jgi:hypothetical protein
LAADYRSPHRDVEVRAGSSSFTREALWHAAITCIFVNVGREKHPIDLSHFRRPLTRTNPSTILELWMARVKLSGLAKIIKYAIISFKCGQVSV